MSKYQSMDAQDVTLRLAAQGETVGEDTVPEGKVGLVIASHGDTVVVFGTLQQLRGLVYDGLALPIPASAPLVDVPDTVPDTL